MNGKIYLPFFIGSVVLFVASISNAQIVPGEGMDSGLGGNNVLTGTVYSSSGQRVGTRIKIRLTTMTRGDRVGSTDENGNFIFNGLISGNYSIVINEKGFEPVSQNVDIIQLRGSPPQTYNVSIRLVPKADATPRPGVIDAALSSLDAKGREIFMRSQELAKAGDHTGAIEQLLILTSDNPNFMPGFNELGVEYLRIGDFEKATLAFDAAHKLDPEAFGPLLNNGIALYQLRKFERAETELRAALAIDKTAPPVHYFLGQTVANLGKFDEAEAELQKALESKTDKFPEAHRTLAIIYSSKKDTKNALRHLEAYIALVPNAPDMEQLKQLVLRLKGLQ